MFLYFWFIMGIYSILINILYPICTSRNEVQKMELSSFILQHSATYSNTLLLKATKMSSNIRIQRICQHSEKEFAAKTTVIKYCGDDYAKRISVAVVLFPVLL